MSDVNIIQNTDLNSDVEPYRGDASMLIPAYWAPWWLPPTDPNNVPAWKNQKPQFDCYYIDGDLAARISSPFATHTAGLLQQTPAVIGETYELTANAQAWSSEAEREGYIQDGSDINLQIGIDPTGGLDPESPVILWSQISQALGKWTTLRLTATAEANIITLFLKSAPQLPKRQQAIFWRGAVLRPTGRYKRSVNIVGPGDTHIQLQPERPHPPQPIKIIASSQRNLNYVDVIVTRPNGETAIVAYQEHQQQDDRYSWTYEVTLEEEGLHDIRFVGDRGARLLAQRLIKAAREVQIIPSGKARLDYRRVYVLMPPTADASWFAAAARGSFTGRYTIGFSADDAGLGEVAERIVIAVNPHHWPQTLTAAWFQQHYAGTQFIPIIANKPQDLEAWLSEWI